MRLGAALALAVLAAGCGAGDRGVTETLRVTVTDAHVYRDLERELLVPDGEFAVTSFPAAGARMNRLFDAFPYIAFEYFGSVVGVPQESIAIALAEADDGRRSVLVQLPASAVELEQTLRRNVTGSADAAVRATTVEGIELLEVYAGGRTASYWYLERDRAFGFAGIAKAEIAKLLRPRL